MNKPDPEILERALQRERAARKQAESILEDKSRELYDLTQELRSANHKLEGLFDEKKNELQGVFDNLVDAYVLMDVQGNILNMNTSAVKLFGYDVAEEEINVVSLIYKDDYEYAMSSFQQLITQGSFSDYKARVYTKHKGVRTVHINASIIKNSDGRVIGAQGIVRDITVQLEQENQKEQLLHNLEVSNKELNDFAHVVSHDLKSPLRGMNALINWLKEDYKDILDKSAQKSFDSLLQKIEKMDNLIEGILAYSSIDKQAIKEKDIDLNEVVANIISMIYVPDHFTVTIKNKLPTIKGDQYRLQQLFQNIISNAIKYNDKEQGILDISCVDNEDHWEFILADNGPGIPDEYHAKIFEVFQTISTSKESTGVGLSIVKKIVDLYDGSVNVTSEEGKGATFYLILKKTKNHINS
ncbi:sensor histidine kinase [Aquimarina litoralis]|uniref:sensor histidine kinase n=1 Tax=Aquimarina litoralis TaxID=584605 RepID=UPI001C56BCB3|nr:ATP-binding protein [Aquimarina litoralis]MBW1297949.1 PAS domain S-box protein [Aquimarina litoralis]